MTVQYHDFEMYDMEEDVPSKVQASLEHNRSILRSGVVGVSCTVVRMANSGEVEEYGIIIPPLCHLSTTEIYNNGAKNIFVRDVNQDAIGVVIVRP